MTPLDAIMVMFLMASLGLITYMVMLMQRLIADLEEDTKIQKITASRMAANKNVKKLPRPPLPPPPRPENLPVIPHEHEIWE
tara:strand:+ start:1162 stop:1407 length:246 start_codon:yes stop_codon:yes gene_type:complete